VARPGVDAHGALGVCGHGASARGNYLHDAEFGEEIDHLLHAPFDLLLGRRTYEIFAAYWPCYDKDAPYGGIAALFDRITKYRGLAIG
jgi:hypothetical protein